MRCAIKHFSLTLKCFPKNTSSSIQYKINKANNKDNKLLKLSLPFVQRIPFVLR